jgi:hypothetical protein
MNALQVWAALDIVFALRALAFSIEVIRHHSRLGRFYQWTSLAFYGLYVYFSEAWRYGLQGEDPWQAYLLEAAFVIQALADVRYYFAKGHLRPPWFQKGLWVLNGFQGLFLLLRPHLLALVGVYWLLERWLYRRGHYHKHAEG